MISAIVLASESQAGDDVERAQEVVVRSLVWLVSAVVAGVVRNVILAVPAGLGLSEVADQSGCKLIQADSEAGRLSAAVAVAGGPRLLLLRAGFQLDHRIVEEIDAFVRRASEGDAALILAAPDTVIQRLWPARAPVVGVLVPKAACVAMQPTSFEGLVRVFCRGLRLRAAATRIT